MTDLITAFSFLLFGGLCYFLYKREKRRHESRAEPHNLTKKRLWIITGIMLASFIPVVIFGKSGELIGEFIFLMSVSLIIKFSYYDRFNMVYYMLGTGPIAAVITIGEHTKRLNAGFWILTAMFTIMAVLFLGKLWWDNRSRWN